MTTELSQFQRFLDPENFRLALRRLQTSPPSLYKSLYSSNLRHFSFFEDSNIDFVIHSIREGNYNPKPCDRIYAPKNKNLVRPFSVLCFVDLLVYQALVNIIADEFYDFFTPRWNKIVFGNVYRHSTDKSSIFFNVRWKNQWRRYNEQTEVFHNHGYVFFADFDFASYFDTIDHEILCQILERQGIEKSLLDLLLKCLKVWTLVNNRGNFGCNHGIPQGPISSAFLADVYLAPLDDEVIQRSKSEIKYFRYVDDIRVLSKSEIDGQKTVMLIDLIARDFGLIPRPDKVSVYRVNDIRRRLNRIDNKFSQINNIYRSKKRLPSKNHNQLKKHFMLCFDESAGDDYLNKTTLRFSFYKLNKDEEVRETILNHLDLLDGFFEGVAFYLNTHFPNDPVLTNWIWDKLDHDHILFHHLIALIFKTNPTLRFDSDVHRKHFDQNQSFWLTKYYILDWLYQNGKKDLILTTRPQDNHFVDQKLTLLQFEFLTDEFDRNRLIENLLVSKDEMLALQGLYFRAQESLVSTTSLQFSSSENLNPFIRNIITNEKDDYLNWILKKDFHISNSSKFFNSTIWNDPKFYDALKTEFSNFVRKRWSDPSGSLMALDLFNDMVFRKVCDLRGNAIPHEADYGGAIDALKLDFPYARFCFRKIHNARCERTDAHYRDRNGNLRARIKYSEYERLLAKSSLDKALDEICSFPY